MIYDLSGDNYQILEKLNQALNISAIKEGDPVIYCSGKYWQNIESDKTLFTLGTNYSRPRVYKDIYAGTIFGVQCWKIDAEDCAFILYGER